jgi:hypothetical protein
MQVGCFKPQLSGQPWPPSGLQSALAWSVSPETEIDGLLSTKSCIGL